MAGKIPTILILLLWPVVALAAPRTLNIGLVADGPHSRVVLPLELLEGELSSLMGDEFKIHIGPQTLRHGDWTLSGIDRALAEQLRDPGIDVVVALGIISSNQAAKIRSPGKPLIAAITADSRLQGFPLQGGTSGRHHFTYISNFRSVRQDVETFHEAVLFEHLALLADGLVIEAIPELPQHMAPALRAGLGIELSVVPVATSVAEALAAIPPDADAVLVTPLMRLDAGAMRELAKGLADLELPSFSLLGAPELEFGLLMGTGGRTGELTRYARRIALNIQRVALGEDAAGLEVDFLDSPRLMINMRTAQAIQYSPRYAILADAEQWFDESLVAGRPLTLAGAMEEAVATNLDLQVASLDRDLAGDDTALARAALRPQIGLSAAVIAIDEDRANPLIQAERSADAEISVTQILYADDRHANLNAAGHLQNAATSDFRSAVLDIQQATASAFLQYLRAVALETVQRANVEVTRANLDLARLRESIGASARADVLRWESQIATDKRNLIATEADRRQSLNNLNRLTNRPQNEAVQPAGVEDALQIFDHPNFQRFIDNAMVWEVFQEFLVIGARDLSPELAALKDRIAAQDRQVLAARRKFYVPEIALQAEAGTNLDRGGAGADLTGTGLDDESWNVGLVATLPVFNGGALRTRLAREQRVLLQLKRRASALTQTIETRVRLALHRSGGSYPALELTATAAAAGRENLALVRDAYRQGAVSVTDVIDAQNASLAADLANANAQYAYLIDVVEVLRATGDFSLLTDPQTAPDWFLEVEAFFESRGVRLRRR